MKQPKKPNTDLSRFTQEILKTGFPLEYQTSRTLKAAGWTVISSKYYLDDLTQMPREMDLIAYKVSTVSGYSVYTSLIISCKKAQNDVWALLSREVNHSDPNTDWWPLHLWSNNKAINYEIGSPLQKKKFHADTEKAGVKDAFHMPEVDVFAFQIMNKISGAVQNDKPIYDSINSLIHAQAYELSALPSRKKDPVIYQFNLITVLDSELVKLHFDGDEIVASTVTSAHYIARYIIQKQQSFSKIHFIKASQFASALEDYNRLHLANCANFINLENKFFADLLKTPAKIALYLKDFRDRIYSVRWHVYSALRVFIDFSDLTLTWDSTTHSLDIEINGVSDAQLSFLNEDSKVSEQVKSALKAVFRYEGEFRFCDGLPF